MNSCRRQHELARIYPIQNIVPVAGLTFEIDGVSEPIIVVVYCEFMRRWTVGTATGEIPLECGVLSGSLISSASKST